jgi:hypothetical protein
MVHIAKGEGITNSISILRADNVSAFFFPFEMLSVYLVFYMHLSNHLFTFVFFI